MAVTLFLEGRAALVPAGRLFIGEGDFENFAVGHWSADEVQGHRQTVVGKTAGDRNARKARDVS